MKVLIGLLVLAAFLLALLFCVENMDPKVTIHFLGRHSPPLPVSAVALIFCLAGVVFMGLVAFAEGIRMRVRNLQMSRRIRKLEVEVDALRNQGLGPLPAVSDGAEEEPPAA